MDNAAKEHFTLAEVPPLPTYTIKGRCRPNVKCEASSSLHRKLMANYDSQIVPKVIRAATRASNKKLKKSSRLDDCFIPLG